MDKLRVALLQILPNGTDQEANLKKGDEFCRLSKAMDADIALFPEMWNIGYSLDIIGNRNVGWVNGFQHKQFRDKPF